MSSDQSKWADAVAKLSKLTKDGALTWRSATNVQSSDVPPDSVRGLIYVAKQNENLLRLYKLRELVEKPRNIFEMGWTFRPSKPSDFEWAEKVILEMIDERGNSLFTFPQVSGLKDLHSAASYQAAGVKDFLDELLETKK